MFCSMAAESPRSIGLAERYNVVFGVTVSKTAEETSCDLVVAVVGLWVPKNSLKTVNGFSPISLCMEKSPIFPNVSDDLLPALENKTTSQTVAENRKALHSANKKFIKD